MGELLSFQTQSFEDIVEPVRVEMEFTANRIVAEQKIASTALTDILGLELSGNPDVVPLADDTLSCTNPSCNSSTCRNH